MRYVIAVYELDRSYGGPEEGGWWYDTGSLVRIHKVVKSEDQAYKIARRLNQGLAHKRFATGQPSPGISSVAYQGGHLAARVFERTAPEYFPQQRPYFE